MRTVANRDSPVQMFVDRHPTSSKRVTKARLVYLPASIRYGYRIVLGNDSLRLDREHQIEIFAITALKCCPLFLCPSCLYAANVIATYSVTGTWRVLSRLVTRMCL